MNQKIQYAKDEQLPSYEEIVEGFKNFELLNLTGLEYQEIKQKFFESLKLIPKIISPGGTMDFNLYRTSCINEIKLDINDIQTFSFPPVQFCNKGRCNLKGFPVFYTSISSDTALRERRKENGEKLENGDEVYLSVWKIKKGVTVNYSQFIFDESIELGNIIKKLNITNAEKLKKKNETYTTNKQLAFEYLLNKLASYFISDDYTISSFLAHNILYDGREKAPINSDALIYPSLQAGLNSINIAFHPDFVKNNIYLEKVEKIKFKNFEKSGSKINLIKTGIPDETQKIKWFTSVVNTNWMKIIRKEIMFEVDPIIEILDEKCIFFRNGNKKEIDEIIWEYINENIKSLVEILFQIDKEIDYDKIYEKEFYINTNDRSTALIKDNKQYIISNFKILLEYKILKEYEN